MKKDSRLFEDSKSFLDDFFHSFEGLTKLHSTDYFVGLFQKPLDFPTLLDELQPSIPSEVLLLDGQSRVGKTWTAVGLIREMLDRQMIDTVWSSGEDSRFVFSDKRTTIADGIRWVANSLESYLAMQPPSSPIRLIVLLDDFFGSARLRAIASDKLGFQLVKDFLTCKGDQNPILRIMNSHQNVQASLLMTGRSSIFSVAEIRLDVPLGARVGRIERAFYETVDGKLVDVGDYEWLDGCLNIHNEFVREHQEFSLPPMTAFSSGFPTTEPYNSVIPDILFGGDLRAIIEEFKHDKRLTKALHGSFSTKAQTRLRRLLLIYVAPALVLPIPSIDTCLTGKENPRKVRAVLSLQPEEHGDFALRVPNRYYLRAIQQQLLETESLTILADSLIAQAEGLKERCGKHLHVLSRGLIERGLESVDEALKQQDDDGERRAAKIRKALSEKVQALPGVHEEPLLKWEAALVSDSLESQDVTEVAEKVPCYPGLASAIGWGLYRFRRDRRIESTTLNYICGAFERRAKELCEQEDYRVLTVAYSNFIRWAAQMEEAPAGQSPIHQLAQVPASIGMYPHTKAALMMVLEDALIWADSFKLGQDALLTVRNLPPAHELWDALESESRGPTTTGASSIANRLFSLEWHNEWKERPGYRREVLVRWLQNNQELALELIREKPELLDDNLAYHWSHMITQWSAWARDWCFSPDPNAHEFQKEPIGCSDQNNNQGIHNILKQAMDSAIEHGNPRNRLRNAFFLLAIRSGGPLYNDLSEVHTYLGEVITRASSASSDIKRDLVQALYELIRQGYLDRTVARISSPHGDDRKHQLPKSLRAQCVNFLDLHGLGEWEAYIKELEGITCLDVLPYNEADLIPYGRSA